MVREKSRNLLKRCIENLENNELITDEIFYEEEDTKPEKIFTITIKSKSYKKTYDFQEKKKLLKHFNFRVHQTPDKTTYIFTQENFAFEYLQNLSQSDQSNKDVKDLYALADAHYNGRSAGTLDELKASMWLGEQYRAIGLKPAGDDGTYFQFFNMVRNRVSIMTK